LPLVKINNVIYCTLFVFHFSRSRQFANSLFDSDSGISLTCIVLKRMLVLWQT
jgi:hypothetical protein